MNRYLYPSMKANSEFWRKKQNVLKRKKKTANFKRVVIFLPFFLLFFLIYFGFLKLENYFRNSEVFKVKEIKIHAKSEGIKGEIEDRIKGLELGSILFVEAEEIRKNIMKNPYVRDVKIKKILPSRIEIFVEEREGIAILRDKDNFVIDENGEAIEKVEDLNSLPLIRGVSLKDRIAIEMAVSLLKDLKDLGYEKLVEEVDVSNPFNIGVKMRNSKVKVYLGESGWLDKFKRYLEIEGALQKELGEIEYVGFYDKERVYVKGKGQI